VIYHKIYKVIHTWICDGRGFLTAGFGSSMRLATHRGSYIRYCRMGEKRDTIASLSLGIWILPKAGTESNSLAITVVY